MKVRVGVLPWLMLLVAVCDWVALKTETVRHPPWMLMALVAVTCSSFALRVLILVRMWLRGTRRWASAGELVSIAGLLLSLGAGSANWLMGLQGFVVLHEGGAVPLHGASHLQEFHEGPLARIRELDVTAALEEVELVAEGPDHFFPRSHLVVTRGVADSTRIEIDREQVGALGSLRFYQGAFGFAPRILIEHDGRTVFDEVVPFMSRLTGGTGLAFEGRFTVEREKLAVAGSVDLESLDASMRGHASLDLELHRDGELLGRGRLLPGHFADLAQGYRVGFGGLKKWSEVDISRRSYGGAVKSGAALALFGLVLWAGACWRGR